MRRLACALMLVAVGAPLAWGQVRSEWEERNEDRLWSEEKYALPPLPREDDLVEFQVSALSDFRFLVDTRSISVGKDGVVRFTLVARSPGGVDNVSYEGIRCRSRSVRVYARAQKDGTWLERGTPWRPIETRSVMRWHDALYGEYFCPLGIPIFDAREGGDALRRGGNDRAALPGGGG